MLNYTTICYDYCNVAYYAIRYHTYSYNILCCNRTSSSSRMCRRSSRPSPGRGPSGSEREKGGCSQKGEVLLRGVGTLRYVPQ